MANLDKAYTPLCACLLFDPVILHSYMERALTPDMLSLQLRHLLMTLKFNSEA